MQNHFCFELKQRQREFMNSSDRPWGLCNTPGWDAAVGFLLSHCCFKAAELLLLCVPLSGSAFFIWMTLLDAVYQVMTQKGSKGFFVKMFTTWSNFLNWLSFKSFFVISSLTHANFTRTVLPQFKDFSQGQNKAMGKWAKQNVPGLLFFSVCHSGFFSLAPAQFGSWAHPMKLTGFTPVSFEFTFRI